VTLLRELDQLLRTRLTGGVSSALLIDEAQSLPHELLEEIRLLANMETPNDKLLPVVLAGQPELGDRLNEPALRQLKQRVALRCDLMPLQLQETAAYIHSRLQRAGGRSSEIFTREAVVAIHEGARGIPRSVSVICDNALISGFAADRKPVDEDIVFEVCRDLDFGHVERRSAQRAGPPQAGQPRRPAEASPPATTAKPEADPTAEAALGGGAGLFAAARRRFSFF
jgi:general secretion pathway protein A